MSEHALELLSNITSDVKSNRQREFGTLETPLRRSDLLKNAPLQTWISDVTNYEEKIAEQLIKIIEVLGDEKDLQSLWDADFIHRFHSLHSHLISAFHKIGGRTGFIGLKTIEGANPNTDISLSAASGAYRVLTGDYGTFESENDSPFGPMTTMNVTYINRPQFGHAPKGGFRQAAEAYRPIDGSTIADTIENIFAEAAKRRVFIQRSLYPQMP